MFQKYYNEFFVCKVRKIENFSKRMSDCSKFCSCILKHDSSAIISLWPQFHVQNVRIFRNFAKTTIFKYARP